jgi:hypothetical protein
MNLYKILIGIIYGTLGQLGSFMQLQGSYKYGWDKKYMWIILLFSVPITWLYMRSVSYFIEAFDGQIWPSRLIGFGVGVIVFTLMSVFLFKEPLNIKNSVCLFLGFLIVAIQLYFK